MEIKAQVKVPDGWPAPSMDVQAKAARYLCEGRVQVAQADGETFSATVQGSGTYSVVYGVPRAEGWDCTCRSTRTCAHLVACWAIWPTPAVEPPRLYAVPDDPFARFPGAYEQS